MSEPKPFKVRISITVEVDPAAWELTYGIDARHRREMREDVERYCYNCVADSQAVVEGAMTAVR